MATVRQRQAVRGIDPLKVMKQMIAETARAASAEQEFQFYPLIFGQREDRKGNQQIMSVVDLGDGQRMDVFPILQRFQPPEGKVIHCYVATRSVPVRYKGEIERDKDGNPKTRLVGFAIPADLLAAEQDGYWRGAGNNLIACAFQGKDREVEVRVKGKPETRIYTDYVGRGPNGKVVLAAPGFVPSTGVEIVVQVTEKINLFWAHCVVPEEVRNLPEEAQEQALVRMAETVGAVLAAADDYRIKVGGRPYDACAVLNTPSTASRAEIKARFKELQAANAPDKKVAEHQRLTGKEPPAALVQQWNHSFAVVTAAKDRMLLVLERYGAMRKYLNKGKSGDPAMPAQIMVGQLAGRAECSHELARRALERIGYPGVVNKTMLSRDIAWTALGLIRSGALDEFRHVDVDRTAVEAKPTNGAAKAEEPEKPVNEAALKLALATGAKVDGRPAAEVVQELKAERRLPPHWPAPEPEPGEEVVEELPAEDVDMEIVEESAEGQPAQ